MELPIPRRAVVQEQVAVAAVVAVVAVMEETGTTTATEIMAITNQRAE